ncbi:MAG: hypothetical protein LJE94_06305 [Deltaproteobacteria bacterium]|nr:hypothetical protein [Deltaproteobacteria bacterium]
MEINRFNAFEDQVSYFTEKTGVYLPRMTFGKGAFFRDLGTWSNTYRRQRQAGECVHILPDPVQGLSFPRPMDVLSSALSLSATNVEKGAVYDLLERFGLPAEKATQPVISLSGGEILLLNFAKAMAMRPFVSGLVACSPIHWLNEGRYHYWRKLADAFHHAGRFVNVALLKGEPFIDENNHPAAEDEGPVPAIDVQLVLEDPVVVFEEIRFPSYHPASRIAYRPDVGGQRLDLVSPVLMTGDNGVGKSVFGKLLCGIIKPAEGALAVAAPNKSGDARLIFQDAIDQLFGKSIDGHLGWVFRFDEKARRLARDLYAEIDGALRAHWEEGRDGAAAPARRCTLLQAKISLIAERLATRPAVLILDEPGWGLSRSIARRLVAVVCRAAANLDVAVVLISHHARWWQGMVHSRCHLSQAGSETVVMGVR